MDQQLSLSNKYKLGYEGLKHNTALENIKTQEFITTQQCATNDVIVHACTALCYLL